MDAGKRYLRFMAVQKPMLMRRLIRQQQGSLGSIILDLEDVFLDPFDPPAALPARINARQHLRDLARHHAELFTTHAIGLRINACPNDDFQRDLELLRDIVPIARLHCLVLPKIKTPEQLDTAVSAVKKIIDAETTILPTLECSTSVASLNELIPCFQQHGLSHVIYGHFDHMLDCGRWPFVEPDDATYWDILRPLIEQLETHGLHFINTPISDLTNSPQLHRLLQRLSSICTKPFLIISLSKGHSQAFEAFDWNSPRTDALAEPKRREPSTAHATELARDTVRRYLANRHRGNSFALDIRQAEFIPPQMFLAARRHLQEHDPGFLMEEPHA